MNWQSIFILMFRAFCPWYRHFRASCELFAGHANCSHPMRNVRRDFSQGIFKVASKAPYWPEGVGEACGWPFIPPGCNWLSLLPLLEGFKVAKNFLAFHPLSLEKRHVFENGDFWISMQSYNFTQNMSDCKRRFFLKIPFFLTFILTFHNYFGHRNGF